MSEHDLDELTATGAHRVWRGGVGAASARSWLNRSQPANPRHAAITSKLANFPNYRSWAEKVKTAWRKEEE
ncbi:MAG: hypothetical protein AB7T07_07560 [Steroidobacteraceae bacterium]